MTPPPDLVRTYFDRAASPDLQAYFDQFAAEAIVEDEGQEYRGLAAIRSWRTSVAPVSYDIREITEDDGGVTTANTGISGDFPGSPVTLAFRFRFQDDGLISTLTIRI